MAEPIEQPRRFVRMFRPQFARAVESWRKLQTIRPWPKRVPRIGDILDAREWSGKAYRSPQRRLAEGEITGVFSCSVYENWIRVDDEVLRGGLAEVFAVADGFADFEAMRTWFAGEHGLPFLGGMLLQWRQPEAKP